VGKTFRATPTASKAKYCCLQFFTYICLCEMITD
jgi:hypothetical protein